MEAMVSISFMIYLAALLLAPLIAAFYAGFRAAFRMAVAEVVIVIAAWLLIAAVSYLLQGDGWRVSTFAESASGGLIRAMAKTALGSFYLLLLIPLQTVLAGLAAAVVGSAALAAWLRLRR
jgi:hypothetical protein